VGKRGVTRYHAYGVSVVSELPLPFPAEPPSDGRRALARVEFVEANDGDFHGFPSASMPADSFICDDVPGRGAYLRWPGLYDFVVDEPGSRIACRALDGCNASVFHNFLFGQVVAAALVRQGLEPLHAAAVAIEDGAIAFLGDCTYGKSTLLASFAHAGHRALTDDMLILERDAGEFHAWPGAGRVKLMPDSARRILRRSDGVQLTPLTTKRSFALDRSSQQRTRLPLRLLYVLPTPEERERTAAIEIRRASAAETVRELVTNTFTAHRLDRNRLVRQFEHATDIAAHVESFRLRYPAGLDRVAAVRDAIAEHATHVILRVIGATLRSATGQQSQA